MSSSLSQANSGAGGKGKVTVPPGINKELFRTKICNYYKQSKECQWGDKCFFAHGDKELRPFVRTLFQIFQPTKSYPSSSVGKTHNDEDEDDLGDEEEEEYDDQSNQWKAELEKTKEAYKKLQETK